MARVKENKLENIYLISIQYNKDKLPHFLYTEIVIPPMIEFVVIVTFLNLALLGLVPNVDASYFYGVQLAVDMFQNKAGGSVTVDLHWREIWNATTTLATSPSVDTCETGSSCPSPSTITMSSRTSNCQQTVNSASGV